MCSVKWKQVTKNAVQYTKQHPRNARAYAHLRIYIEQAGAGFEGEKEWWSGWRATKTKQAQQ